MNELRFRSENSLKREFHLLHGTQRRRTRPRTVARTRYRSDNLMTQQAQLGVQIVQIVARDLRVAPRPDATEHDRIAVMRAQDGRYWELLVLRGGLPTARVIAGLRRSLKPPWRLDRLTYFTTPLNPE